MLSTQYRGSRGSKGKGEDSGSDVYDVQALFDIAKTLPEANTGKMFLYGLWRGGMMVYQALRAGAIVRAAAVNSGVSDAAGYRERSDAPEMEELMREAIPHFKEQKKLGFASRSAVLWASDLHVPLLLLYGTADSRVRVTQSLRRAIALQKANRSYELHVFEQGKSRRTIWGISPRSIRRYSPSSQSTLQRQDVLRADKTQTDSPRASCWCQT